VLIRGRITGVELYDGEPYATIGGSILPLKNLIAIDEAAADAAAPVTSTPVQNQTA
jgi:flagellar basal-body rod modification protein FlgD